MNGFRLCLTLLSFYIFFILIESVISQDVIVVEQKSEIKFVETKTARDLSSRCDYDVKDTIVYNFIGSAGNQVSRYISLGSNSEDPWSYSITGMNLQSKEEAEFQISGEGKSLKFDEMYAIQWLFNDDINADTNFTMIFEYSVKGGITKDPATSGHNLLRFPLLKPSVVSSNDPGPIVSSFGPISVEIPLPSGTTYTGTTDPEQSGIIEQPGSGDTEGLTLVIMGHPGIDDTSLTTLPDDIVYTFSFDSSALPGCGGLPVSIIIGIIIAGVLTAIVCVGGAVYVNKEERRIWEAQKSPKATTKQ